MDIFYGKWSCMISLLLISTLSFLFACFPSSLHAAETFLEPNQYIDIRSPYQVTVQSVHVEEGQTIKSGDVMVELDSRILRAREQQLLKESAFHGVLDSAKAMVKMQQDRLTMLEKLSKSGNARRQELEKVKTDLAISRAKLLEAKEGRERTLLELDIIKAQVEERRLKSPISAVVLKIYKQPSEMTSPTDPEPVISLVQLNPLLAVFHLPVHQAQAVVKGETVKLLMNEKEIPAIVDFISPVIEAQSGTVRVRFRVANSDGTLLSGRRVSYEP